MPKPRYAQVALEATPYYHCISRCVRRAFLCGLDTTTGNNYEHRRQLIEDKILELSNAFAIDFCVYSVMSNHYHLVLHINKAQAEKWTPGQVIEQWHQLFNGTLFSQRYARNETLLASEFRALTKSIENIKTKHTNEDHLATKLYPFIGNPRKNMSEGLPFNLKDYIELVDITGRIMREDKRGAISQNTPQILKRLNIDVEHWQYLTKNFESKLKGLVGSVFRIKEA